MTAVEAAAPAMGMAPACVVLGLPRATLYRRRRSPTVTLAPRPASPRALDPLERQAVLDTLHSARFLDAAPAQVHATLLDEGTYLCSPRTMHRLLETAGEIKERRKTKPHETTETHSQFAVPRSFAEDGWRNVYAVELEVRPPAAPTTDAGPH